MPETYGIPEPEPTRAERAQFALNEVVAGQSVTRRVILYAVAFIAIVALSGLTDSLIGFIAAIAGGAALVLLMSTDSGLD